MAAADKNVRPGREAPAANARGARRFRLARLLLHSLESLQLDRKLLVFLAASLMPACIIPVGPDWQDPRGEPNSPPVVQSAMPDEGTTTTSSTPTFRVTVSDLNLTDPLFVRWIADFPDFGPSTRELETDELSPSTNGSPLREASVEVTCLRVDRMGTTHKITAAVSDQKFRPFVSRDDLLAVEKDTVVQKVVWVWEQACPP